MRRISMKSDLNALLFLAPITLFSREMTGCDTAVVWYAHPKVCALVKPCVKSEMVGYALWLDALFYEGL